MSNINLPDVETTLHIRAYDEGIAFRYILNSVTDSDIHIIDEQSRFKLLGNYYCYDTYTAQGEYTRTKLSNLKSECERPLVIEGDDIYIAIGEAALIDYSRMKLSYENNNTITSRLSGYVIKKGNIITPWRLVMAAKTPGELLQNNYLILNLNKPSNIKDTGYIKPGKVIREITLTTRGAFACVDFAVRNNLQYVEFDAGWYGYEYDDESDASFVSLDPKRSKGPFDLSEIINYANDNGIGVILYVNQRALSKQLDEILPIFKKWGVKGIKFGFVNVGSQYDTSWLHEAVRKCAEYEFLVDIHDEYRPTGYCRTYPNLLTQEGIRGDEELQPNSNTLTIAFTRMIVGAADNTVCYFDKRVYTQSSHAYQLAKAVVFYSPLQFLYWYDRPLQSSDVESNYNIIDESCSEIEFYRNIPTVWDDTKVLDGAIGKYIITARKSGDDWFIGVMNADETYKTKINFTFLDNAYEYRAVLYYDNERIETKTKVGIKEIKINNKSSIDINIPPNQGMAIHLKKLI